MALLALAAVLSGNAGCASTGARREEELAVLAARLPGDYDNLAQVKAEAASAGTGHAAMRLRISALSVPIVSQYVFHVRETAADDPRRVIAQSIWTLSLLGDQLVQSRYQFAEPERWRTADPAVLRALLPRDLRLLGGCELRWTRAGTDMNATGKLGSCRDTQAGAEGGELLVEQWQIQGEQLSIVRQRYRADGAPLAGAESDPWYRFNRSR
jgi:hypothetical protein